MSENKKSFSEKLKQGLEILKQSPKNIYDKTKKEILNNIDRKKKAIENFKTLDKKEKITFVKEKLIDNALYIIIFLFVIGVSIYNSKFISKASIINIVNQSAPRLIMALGVGGIIVLTGTDLSAGRIMAFVSIITASLLQSTDYASKMFPSLKFSPWLILLSFIISIIIGGLFGALNGLVVAKFKLHPFIVTLGTQLILYGLILWYVSLGSNNNQPLGGVDRTYGNVILGGFTLGSKENGIYISNYLWYALIITVIMWTVWNKTKIGKNMFAVGSNEEAAAVSGVSVFLTIVVVFTIAGVLYSFTGMIETVRVGSNSPSTGVEYELDAIAACVIGGVSFMGGVGKIRGIIMGVLLLQIVQAALVFLDLTSAPQKMVKGIIILLASAIDMRKYIAKK